MLMATTQASETAKPRNDRMTAGYTMSGSGRIKSLKRLVFFGTPDQRLSSCFQVFFGICPC